MRHFFHFAITIRRADFKSTQPFVKVASNYENERDTVHRHEPDRLRPQSQTKITIAIAFFFSFPNSSYENFVRFYLYLIIWKKSVHLLDITRYLSQLLHRIITITSIKHNIVNTRVIIRSIISYVTGFFYLCDFIFFFVKISRHSPLHT